MNNEAWEALCAEFERAKAEYYQELENRPAFLNRSESTALAYLEGRFHGLHMATSVLRQYRQT